MVAAEQDSVARLVQRQMASRVTGRFDDTQRITADRHLVAVAHKARAKAIGVEHLHLDAQARRHRKAPDRHTLPTVLATQRIKEHARTRSAHGSSFRGSIEQKAAMGHDLIDQAGMVHVQVLSLIHI